MPLTPFHLGPALLLGEFFEKRINIISILLASVLVDTRAFYCFLFGCTGRFHGPLHTLLGTTFIILTALIIVWSSRKYLKTITDIFKIRNNYSFRSIILGSSIGAWSHIILDSFMHSDIIPFWPIKSNLLLGMITNSTNYLICTTAFITGLAIFTYKLIKRLMRKTKSNNYDMLSSPILPPYQRKTPSGFTIRSS
jgi:membrane-bound metal-dependent hydrolase YbcI (DUF457 family)